MDEELWQLLAGAPAMVLAGIASSIHWTVRPQGSSLPSIVLNVVSGAEGMHMTGTDGLFSGRVQIDCYGADRDDARRVSKAVAKLLHGYRGGGFQGCFIDSTRDNFEAGALGRPFRISHDLLVNWSEGNG